MFVVHLELSKRTVPKFGLALILEEWRQEDRVRERKNEKGREMYTI